MCVCSKLWTLEKAEAISELKNFYVSVIQMDNTLLNSAKFGFTRHINLYEKNYARNITG